MNLIKNKLKKLEKIHLKAQVTGITEASASHILLSNGLVVNRNDNNLSKYHNLNLFELNDSQPRLNQLLGSPGNVTTTELAKLLLGWRKIRIEQEQPA